MYEKVTKMQIENGLANALSQILWKYYHYTTKPNNICTHCLQPLIQRLLKYNTTIYTFHLKVAFVLALIKSHYYTTWKMDQFPFLLHVNNSCTYNWLLTYAPIVLSASNQCYSTGWGHWMPLNTTCIMLKGSSQETSSFDNQSIPQPSTNETWI